MPAQDYNSGRYTKVRDTEIIATDSPQQYRQKLARIALDEMYQFVAVLDARGTLLEVNRAALEGAGLKLSDVEGKPFWQCYWWAVSTQIQETLQDAIARVAQGEFIRYDVEAYGRAGGKETIIVDFSMIPVKDETGKVVFIVPEGRDITEKKAYEEEIAKNLRERVEKLAEIDRAKTRFFSNVSHEFRTPLTLILGPTEDLLALPADSLTPEVRTQLDLIHRNSLRLQKLVNTLLDFSRLEAGRIQASYEPTDLGALTGDLASVFRSAVEKAGLKLIVDCPPLAEPVYVDRDMWEKVVLNLLSNAFKFTLAGEIQVTQKDIGHVVQMSVRDTGAGIAAEELPRIFERFHRVEGAQSRTHEGTGIGLALVQELVKLHGGTVAIESVFGKGSTFTVTLPKGTAHLPADRVGVSSALASTALAASHYLEEALRWLPEVSAGISPLPPGATPDGARETRALPRILLADDNADMRDYVRRLLSERYLVQAVADGEAALVAARENPPDLILSDVMMPRLDGFGLLREVRADPRTRNVPVLLLSARAGEESRVAGMDSGADDYLVKPFSARELLARVGAHLNLARVRREADADLRESEERFRTLFDLGPIAVYSCDVSGVIRDCNRTAVELWGREPKPGDTDERFCGSFKMYRPDGTFMPHDQCPMSEVLCPVKSRRCATGKFTSNGPTARGSSSSSIFVR